MSTFRSVIRLHLIEIVSLSFRSVQITDFDAPCILYIVCAGFSTIFLEMEANETLPKHFFTIETLFVFEGVCALSKKAFAKNSDGFAK